MKKNIKVSIIIPVYNGEKYIKNCLDSVLKQSYNNIEIVIVNDGSTDSTIDIVNQYLKTYNNLKLINIINSGVSCARNTALNYASGDYIMFIDSDDIMLPDAILKLVNIIKQNNSIEIIRFNAYEENKSGNLVSLEKLPKENINKKNHNNKKIIDMFISVKKSIRGYSWLLFIKNNNIIKFDTNLKYLEDTLFCIHNMCKFKNIFFYDENLYVYKYNCKSVTKEKSRALENINLLLNSYDIIYKFIYANDYKMICVNNWIINLLFYRFDYYGNIFTIREFSNLLNNLYLSERFINIFNNIDAREFKKFKAFEVFLFKKRLFKTLYFIINLKNKIRG